MNSEITNIVKELKKYETQGLTFYLAKDKLLKRGYTESAIAEALDDFQYSPKDTSYFINDADIQRQKQTINSQVNKNNEDEQLGRSMLIDKKAGKLSKVYKFVAFLGFIFGAILGSVAYHPVSYSAVGGPTALVVGFLAY